MFQCERLFGISRGLEIQEMVESLTGALCPCKTTGKCLLLPESSAELQPLADAS